MNLWILGCEKNRNSGVFKYSESLSNGLKGKGHPIVELILSKRFFYLRKYVLLPFILLSYSLSKKYSKVIFPDESYAFLYPFSFGFEKRYIIIHDYRDENYNNLREVLKSIIMKINCCFFCMFDAVICVSEFTKKELLNGRLFINKERVKVVHNPISFPSLNSANYKDGFFDFIYIGSHESRKNTLKILEAFSRLKERNTRLLVLGSPIDSKIYSKFKELACDIENVICYGEVDELFLMETLASSSCFVCASDFEGFGRTPVEAQYFGVPVISTSLAALKEVLPLETKIEIAAPVTPESIFRAMKVCYNLNEQERSYLVQRAKINVERFQLNALVNKFEVLVLNEKNISDYS